MTKVAKKKNDVPGMGLFSVWYKSHEKGARWCLLLRTKTLREARDEMFRKMDTLQGNWRVDSPPPDRQPPGAEIP